MKRVLHIFGVMNRGGAETRTMEIFRGIVSKDVVFDFLSCSGFTGEYDDEIRQLGGTVHKIRINSPMFPLKFFKLLRTEKYDTVHSHIHYSSGYIMIFAKIAKCNQRISHFRITNPVNYSLSLKDMVLFYFLKKLSTHICAVNETTMDNIMGKMWKNNQKCLVLQNGIEEKSFSLEGRKKIRGVYEVNDTSILAINISRIDPQKNHYLILKIMDELLLSHPEAKMLFVGNNDTIMGNQIKSILNNSANKKSFIFAGVTNNVADFYSASDVQIFPSFREGLPGAVLEALSNGLPVVASNIPSHQEIFKQIPYLVLVNLESSLNEWVSAVEHARTFKRSEISQSFLQSDYDIRNCIEKYYKCYFGKI